jgi:L-alanine-DL-glutamate epimerase-like enolase superfamily enzyme
LFGTTPEETFSKAQTTSAAGFTAVKFGWGAFGKYDPETDKAHLMAAREGMGKEAHLMIDAGTVWRENVAEAQLRLSALKAVNAYWLEEPFVNGALNPYKKLSQSGPVIPLAGGEGCNNFVQAQAMMDYAGLSFIQIDAGRVGGITVADKITKIASERDLIYVNHTFTSHLALSASLQSYAGHEKFNISEYPVELKSLAQEITLEKITAGADGFLRLPEKPGLGMTIDTAALKKYLVETEIKIKGKIIYHTPGF